MPNLASFRNMDFRPRPSARKDPGFFASLKNDTRKQHTKSEQARSSPVFPPEPESEMSSSTFRDFLPLGAGVTPAEGSVKPTAGFHIQSNSLQNDRGSNLSALSSGAGAD